jgi:signal transduction histidine kinase
LWFGTDNGGLNRYDYENDRFIKYKKNPDQPNSISDNKILTIYEDLSGQIWLGTTTGLNKMNAYTDSNLAPSFTHYTTLQGLPTNTIHGILEDDNGNLWISTNNGLSKFNPEKEKFTNFNTSNGLQDKEFGVNSCYKDTLSGKLYFGGISGFNVFHPDSIKLDTIVPKIALTNFKLFNQNIFASEEKNNQILLKKAITYTDEIILSYDDDVFTIEFSALHYISPENNQYAYKLDGFEETWNYVNYEQRMATYTNLDPGRYTFLVKAANSDGIWNNNPKTLKILVTSPYWDTAWFRGISIVVIFCSILIIFFYSLDRVNRRNRSLEKRVKERTAQLEELNKELEAFTYAVSHDLRAPVRGLNGFSDILIQDYADVLDKNGKDYLDRIKKASKYLGSLIEELLKLSRLSRQETKFDKFDLSILSQSIIDEYTADNPHQQTEIKIHSPLSIYGDKGLIKVMMKNLIDNAWKFSSNSKVIKIEIGQIARRNESVLFVRDQGIGFDENYADKLFEAFQRFHTEFEGTGIGLATVKRIINRHGGKIWAESSKGEGSTFYFVLDNEQFSSDLRNKKND